jgi:hypothetical protein
MDRYKKIFLGYLIFLIFFVIFFLSAVHNSPPNNSMAEWVINYQGGFTRRGFLGEFIFQFSQFFDFQLRKSFLGMQILIYLAYFYCIYILFNKIRYNYVFTLAIFSPLFFVFSLTELEALGRKDILMFLVFITNFIIYDKFKNLNYNYLYFLFSFPLVFLTHEIYIIYTCYFLAFFIILEKKINLFFIFKFILIFIVILFFLYLITSNEFSQENLQLLCENLKNKSNENCGLAPYSMTLNIAAYQNEIGWKLSHVIRYIGIFLIGFLGLIILIFFSKINPMKTNNYIRILNLKLIFLILALPSILPFLTAVDSGRYSSMAYTFPCVFYFGLLRIGVINFDHNKVNLLLEKTFLKSKKYKIILLILICFTWTPKAVYHEDISSLPLYRTIVKTKYFIGNFKNFSANSL